MNKNGWGLRAELGFLLLFLLCLLTATIGMRKLGIFGRSEIDTPKTEEKVYDYALLENNLVEAAKRYYDDYYPQGSHDTVIIDAETLKNNGYLTALYDGYGRECKGYAKVLNTGTTVSYIRCALYKTTGYSEEYE